jgi:methyltransferase (TIGR00027 family)
MNEGTTDIRHVTGTAFVVAEFRACENAAPHPLYVDRVVAIFLDERTRAAANAIRADFPAAEMNVRLRTRYFDDRLDEQLARGCRQIVILGAGLDTRAVRKQADGVAYFEIDDPGTMNFKRVRLAERGIDAPVTFIPGNYVETGVLPLLEANGFRRDLPSFFIWEGNTMYLTRDTAMQVLQDLRRACKRSASPSTTWIAPPSR